MSADLLQFGALGLLALVLIGGARAGAPIAKSLVQSINGLSDEVASFRRQQVQTSHLLTLLLAREFGEEKALELLREDHDDDGRNQQGRGEAAAGPRSS